MKTLTKLALFPAILWPGYWLYGRLSFYGAFRTAFPSVDVEFASAEKFILPELITCEDLAVHQPSGYIFTACQTEWGSRHKWFPAMAVFDDPEAGFASRGQIWAIDPKTWDPIPIKMENWDQTFATHGIDIYPTSDPSMLYLHAVNHPPAMIDGKPQPKENATVEIFLINLKTFTATHKATVRDPLIRMPNDLLSLGPYEFLVTNDHVNDRGLLRFAEDLLGFSWTSRTYIVHVDAGLTTKAKIVADGLHYVNGLSPGPNGTVAATSAAGGRLITFNWDLRNKELVDKYVFPTIVNIDTPTYFSDPYATDEFDASGYVLGGLLTGIKLEHQARDTNSRIPTSVSLVRQRPGQKLEKRLILEDDGQWASGAATAVIAPIPPVKGSGKREGWLVITGPWAPHVSVIRIDLTHWARKV